MVRAFAWWDHDDPAAKQPGIKRIGPWPQQGEGDAVQNCQGGKESIGWSTQQQVGTGSQTGDSSHEGDEKTNAQREGDNTATGEQEMVRGLTRAVRHVRQENRSYGESKQQ